MRVAHASNRKQPFAAPPPPAARVDVQPCWTSNCSELKSPPAAGFFGKVSRDAVRAVKHDCETKSAPTPSRGRAWRPTAVLLGVARGQRVRRRWGGLVCARIPLRAPSSDPRGSRCSNHRHALFPADPVVNPANAHPTGATGTLYCPSLVPQALLYLSRTICVELMYSLYTRTFSSLFSFIIRPST